MVCTVAIFPISVVLFTDAVHGLTVALLLLNTDLHTDVSTLSIIIALGSF